MEKDVFWRGRVTGMANDAQNRLALPQAGMASPVLTGGLIHDFNNLLQVILGNAGAMANELRDEPDHAKRMSLIVKAAEKGKYARSRTEDD